VAARPPMRFKHTLGGGAAKARGSGGFRASPHAGDGRGRGERWPIVLAWAMGNSTYLFSCKFFSDVVLRLVCEAAGRPPLIYPRDSPMD
jgi:hypothetical protein